MTTEARQTPKRDRPLPEPFRKSVEAKGWGLDPWVLLPIPFAIGLIYGWAIFPLALIVTLIGYVALEALSHRRRAQVAGSQGTDEASASPRPGRTEVTSPQPKSDGQPT